MAQGNYLEIPLEKLSSNPRNPRKGFTGPKFDELLASIKEKGVIEPIIVRPKKAGGRNYEIVAGERRLRASLEAGLKMIPAIVRELTDEQAFDFMLIENLQREDLTEFEEAQSFQLYIGRHGEKGALELAGRTGISPRYIRRRMAVLHLPEYALEAWRKGKLKYGHLEQLLRVKDSPGKVKELFKMASEIDRWDGPTTVEELKRRIDNESPALGLAYFPVTPEGCEACPKNSMVQRDLFGIDDARKSRCLDPACFKKKQNDWLLAHWEESPPGKKYGTSGFRFQDKVDYNEHETVRYNFPPDVKCKACPHFLTVIDATGEPVRDDEQECFNKACLRSRISKAQARKRGKKVADRKPGEPRVSWHGEYFRDLFNRKAIDGLLPLADDAGMKKLAILAIAKAEDAAVGAIGRALGLKAKEKSWKGEAWFYLKDVILPVIKAKPIDIEKILRAGALAVINKGRTDGSGDHAYDSGGFETENRDAVARFLGVDIGKEWAMTEEYLQKKTRAEILEIGKKLKIFADPKTKEYLAKKLKGRDVDKLKKGELVDLVLKSGVELTGRVPAEILKEGK